MINFSKELRKRGLRNSDVVAELGTNESGLWQHIGSQDNPREPKRFAQLAYIAYLLQKDIEKYGIKLEDLIGIEETSLFFRFKEFLVNNKVTEGKIG